MVVWTSLTGQKLGPYEVREERAHGGQATLYKAVHAVLGREVALKVLHPHLITVADYRQKFEAEGRILAQLTHPNIVAVYDAGVDQGLYWIAMEWLPGQSLKERIEQQSPLPVDLALGIADQVAAALEYAHGLGLIHRDIKPGNLMLLPDRTLKVLDFGIAAIVAAGQKARTRIGTEEYVSFEQFQGQADARSDLYSLGASLYHMLTGTLPPKLALDVPIPLRQCNSAVPEALERLVLALLAREPEDRPQTAAEVRSALRLLSAPLPLPPLPIAPATVPCPYCAARNRQTAAYCTTCGQPLAPKPLDVGTILAGRYQITQAFPVQERWLVSTLCAADLWTGAACQVLLMGADPSEDAWLRQLARLRHETLPPMAVVPYQGTPCFVCQAVQGGPLRDVSRFVPAGLQLCSLLETTGARGAGFAWFHLQEGHVVADARGRVWVDTFAYARSWLEEGRCARFRPHEDRIAPRYLDLTLKAQLAPGSGNMPPPAWAARETVIVGAALKSMAGVDLWSGTPLSLRRTLAGLPRTVEQAIVGTTAPDLVRGATPSFISSLSSLRQHLQGMAPGPARAAVQPPSLYLGSVPWGKAATGQLEVTSTSPGLLYGEADCSQPNVRCTGNGFASAHPAQCSLAIAWDTAGTERCGLLTAEVIVTTGMNSFKVPVSVEVRPSAAYHREMARRSLGRGEWEPALLQAKAVLVLEPSDAEAYRLCGGAYEGMGDYDQAQASYSQALKQAPADRAGILNDRGTIYLALDQADRAVTDYTEALLLRPDEPGLFWNRSLAYEAQGEKHKAVADLRRYLALGGKDPDQARDRLAALQGP